METMTGAAWRRSSYSGGSGSSQCVDVRGCPGIIAVRDSKDPDGPRLVLSPTDWRTFTASVKAGQYRLMS
jgi:Domain of unknown function (DUF397)